MTTNSSRILSLDVFRGITIFAMLIVNNPGSWGHIYPILEHAHWNGFGGADWIFPFFLFITGFSIPISIKKYFKDGKYKVSVIFKIFKRSVILFALGIFLNGFPDFHWETIRIPGVLQRIAIVYFISALCFLIASRKGILFLFVFFLSIHWILLTQIPIPFIGKSSLEMGKNLAGWVDYTIMPNHLWIYTKTWDPEGIVGTLSSLSSCLFGVYYGQEFLKKKKFSTYDFYFGIFLGVLFIDISLALNIIYPINKNLWTGTYVLLNSGLAILTLHILYFLIDVSKTKFWYKVFEILGVNALAAFLFSSLISRILNIPFLHNSLGKEIGLKAYLYGHFFTNYFSAYNASIVWAFFYTFLWIFLFSILYKRKIFIKF